MKFFISSFLPQDADTVIRLVSSETLVSFQDPSLSEAWNNLYRGDPLTLKHLEIRSLRIPVADRFINIVLVGFDDSASAPFDSFRQIAARIGTTLKELSGSVVFLDQIDSIHFTAEQELLRQFASILPLCEYRFDRYLSSAQEHPEMKIYVSCSASSLPILEEGLVLSQSVMAARDLVNQTAEEMTPQALAEYCMKSGSKYGFTVEVLDEAKCKELGMGLFLAVAKGSALPPRFIIMRWNGGSEDQQPIAFVGKGITYDSGGLAIKSSGMELMRFDMNGAASVIGAVCAIARQKLPCNVVAVIAACENMVDAHSYRNGDTLTSMSGKTVFVQNTDAEGRLTMADAITYCVQKEHPSAIIEIAGLTGSVCNFFGRVCAAALTTSQPMFEKLASLMDITGEKYAQMPAFPEYRKLLQTPFADLNNAPKDGPGGILAGLFLDSFHEDVPFLHIDSGAMPFTRSSSDCQPEGATGFGVKSLYYYVK